jgi:purine-binding chemotaxis protein CheW
LDSVWREFALGVYRLEKQLMVVLDVDRLLDIKIN